MIQVKKKMRIGNLEIIYSQNEGKSIYNRSKSQMSLLIQMMKWNN